MAFEDMDLEDNEFDLDTDDSSSPEESGNRTFYIVAGVIGGVMLLSLICLALYALVYAPQRRDQQATQNAVTEAAKTLRDIRIVEVIKQDAKVNDEGKIVSYRSKLRLSFKFVRED